ncbi:MAG: nicotinate-nucleotide--dimethylbenzimidazole phosphoribosyltransferase [Acidimicrobiia bacterium]|nr:nicotinate-nucleotide--dimethylbenzimidazole phosphoribosyltransferase [Acidimicrobiia bacterium]
MNEAILFDVGGTLVHENTPGTAIEDLDVRLRRGVASDLKALAGRFRLGAVTNTAHMTESDVRHLLARVDLDTLLEVVVTSVDVGAAKPDPAGLLVACERLGVGPGTALYVGNEATDAAAAAAAGMAYVDVQDRLLPTVLAGLAQASGPFEAARAMLAPRDAEAAGQAAAHLDRLTKPRGSLGRLEALVVWLAAVAGEVPPPPPDPIGVAVFAGDHGVARMGVTPWPQEVTAQMVQNIGSGGAAISVLSRRAQASLVVVDVGVAADYDAGDAVRMERIRRGTGNIAVEPAMTLHEARVALDSGAQVALDLVGAGHRCLVTGEMGIGNTTPSAALIAAFTGRDAAEVTGRGTGIDDAMLAHKIDMVRTAVARLDAGMDPVAVLAEVGGLEQAALTGYLMAGAALRVPVVVDGVIADAALVAAAEMDATVLDFVVAGHRSVEPGAAVALDHLGLRPLLDLELRLGEGTGAILGADLLRAAAALAAEMATFDSAGVSEKEAE